MKIQPIALTIATAFLSACGEADVSEDVAPDTNRSETQRPESFEGSRLAYDTDDMNAAAREEAIAMWTAPTVVADGLGGLSATLACAKLSRGEPSNGKCDGQYAAYMSNAVFNPTRCWKGDERAVALGKAVKPVTCAGTFDAPVGSAKVEMTFFKNGDGNIEAGMADAGEFVRR